MDNKNRLVKLLEEAEKKYCDIIAECAEDGYKGHKTFVEFFADYLIANGVIVTPAVAMVESFIKNGEFDNKHTAHNGRMAVIYIDDKKWACPLIDVTNQFYNTGEAYDRVSEIINEKDAAK